MGETARRSVVAVLAVALLAGPLAGVQAQQEERTEVTVLTFSDWHGQLDPVQGFGGAATLSTYFEQERERNPNTLALTAGDAFGATPPLSNFFDDEPAVGALNRMGLSADGVGNHNFDNGLDTFQDRNDQADYPFLSANLENVDEELDGIKPFELFELDGVTVGVVGVTNPDAEDLAPPGSMGSIEVTDPATAANDARSRAAERGADVVVLMAHMGVTYVDPDTGEGSGPLIDLAENVTGFDAVLGDHTGFRYAERIDGTPVVEEQSQGVGYHRVTFHVDEGGDVAETEVEHVRAAGNVPPDVEVLEYLGPYREEVREIFDEPIGETEALFERDRKVERSGEAALGNLVADAMRERYGTQLAFQNGGGLRATLPSTYKPADTGLSRATPGYADGPPFDLVVGDVFELHPFGNSVVTVDVTGETLYEILEHGLEKLPSADGRFPQVSGLQVVYDSEREPGDRVVQAFWTPRLPGPSGERDPYVREEVDCPPGVPPQVCAGEATVQGRPAVPIPENDETTWSLATNDFVFRGGDGYRMLLGTDGATRDKLANVVLEHIEHESPLEPRTEDRLVDLADTDASPGEGPPADGGAGSPSHGHGHHHPTPAPR